MISQVSYRAINLVSSNGSISITDLANGDTNIQTAGGGGVPASPVNSVQFNNAGAFGGSANFTYSTSTNTFTVGPAGATTIIETLAPTGATVAGTLSFRGTNASATNGDGGSISFFGGVPLGTGTGGGLQFSAGNTVSGAGGNISFISGFGLSQGGSFSFDAGSGNNGDGGQFSMNAGSADGIGIGGRFEMLAGSNSFGSGVGGDFYLQTGGAGSNVSGNFQILIGGGGAGSGTIILGTDSNTDCFRITESSGVSQMGFFNATPVAKPAPTASGTGNVLSSVVTALNSLGLVSSAALTNASTLTAAGANTQIQFNSSNAFGASSNFTYNTGTNTVSFGNITGSALGMTIQPKVPTSLENPGTVSVVGSAASKANTAGGAISVLSGTGTGTGRSGAVTIKSGTGATLTQTGDVSIETGANSVGSSGDLYLRTGATSTSPGSVRLYSAGAVFALAGDRTGGGNAFGFDFITGTGFSGSSGGDGSFASGGANGARAGNLNFTGGNCNSFNFAGGDINFTSGSGVPDGAVNIGSNSGFPSLVVGSDASTSGDLWMYLRAAGGYDGSTNLIELKYDATASVDKLGFFNATPVAKPAPTASGTQAVLDSVVTSLNSLGLVDSAALTNATVITPAGADTQIQYNNAGVLGANANFTYSSALNTLSLGPATGTATFTTRAPSTSQTPSTLVIAAQNSIRTTGSIGTGGEITIRAGNGRPTGAGATGGAININSGLGGTASGDGGAINITAGNSTLATAFGGTLTLRSGNGAGIDAIAGDNSTGDGGGFLFRSGAGGSVGSAGDGGIFQFIGGQAVGTSGSGGTFSMAGGGAAAGGGNGGSCLFTSGFSGNAAFPNGDIQFSIPSGNLPGSIYFQSSGNLALEITNNAGTSAAEIGFFNAVPVGKPTVTGSRSSGAALQDLLTKLASLGLITDSTTA